MDPTQNASSGSVELSQIKFLSSLSSVYLENTNSLPTNYELWQNYPNPFNPTTKISWQLPVSSHVTLKVYDLLGREVTTLVNEEKAPGEYSVEFRALPTGRQVQSLPSGVYFYKLQAGDYTETKKMILLK